MNLQIQPQPAAGAEKVRFVPAADFEQQCDAYSKLVAARAYEIYVQNGRKEGNALKDWCEAERQIGQLVPVGIFDHPEELEINVRLLGCRDQEIAAALEARRLLVRARPDRKMNESDDGAPKTDLGGIFLELYLPAHIDPDNAEVKFENGDLHLTAPKAVVH